MNTETAFFLGYLFAPRVDLALGSAPDARAYFLFSCKKKVAKENARPQRRPAAPGALRCSGTTGGLRNSGLCPSDSPRPFSRCVLRCSTTQRADQEPTGNRPPMASGSFWCASPSPSCSAEQRSTAGGSRRGLSEGRSPEFRSRPAVRVAQGSRQSRPRNAGVAFSLASFFWRPKRKNARASGAETSASTTTAGRRWYDRRDRISPIVRKNYAQPAPGSSNNPPHCVYGRMPVSSRSL